MNEKERNNMQIFHHLTKKDIENLSNYDNSDDYIVITKFQFTILSFSYLFVIVLLILSCIR